MALPSSYPACRSTRARILRNVMIPLALFLVPASAASEGDAHPVTPVDSVKLIQYVGLWHEVAKIPNRFQDQCVCCTSAEYGLREDGRIRVVNRCRKENGKPDEAKGVAKIVPGSRNARLKVSFVSFLGIRPFWGDYWIIGLDPDYRWAVVGTPDREYGWVLSRTPTLDGESMDRVREILDRNGYDWGDFVMSPPTK